MIPIDVISYILYIENKEGSSGHALSDLWAPLSDLWPSLGDMCATLIDLRAPLRNIIMGPLTDMWVPLRNMYFLCTAILIIFSQYYTPDSQTNLDVVTLMKPSVEKVCGM